MSIVSSIAPSIIGCTRPLIEAEGGYSAEAKTLFAAMSTPPTTARKVLINNAIAGLKADGVWAMLDYLHVHAAADSQASTLNWINPATITALVGAGQGSPTFTTDRGFTANGTSSFVDSVFNPTTAALFSQNINFYGVWSLSSAQVATNVAGWLATNGITHQFRSGTDTCTMRMSQNAPSVSNSNTDGTGFYVGARTSSGATRMFKNGVNMTVNSGANQASTALINNSLRLGNPASAVFAAGQFAASCAGGGANFTTTNRDAIMASLYSRLLTYMQAVGAA